MKQIGELQVLDYMTPQAITVDDTAKLTEAIRLLESESLSVLPVVNENEQLVGILSMSDLIEITREIQADLSALHQVNERTQDFLIQLLIEQGNDTRVDEVMSSPVQTVKEGVNMVVAAQKLIDGNYHHLPVMNNSGTLVGVISTSDFVRAFVDHGAAIAG